MLSLLSSFVPNPIRYQVKPEPGSQISIQIRFTMTYEGECIINILLNKFSSSLHDLPKTFLWCSSVNCLQTSADSLLAACHKEEHLSFYKLGKVEINQAQSADAPQVRHQAEVRAIIISWTQIDLACHEEKQSALCYKMCCWWNCKPANAKYRLEVEWKEINHFQVQNQDLHLVSFAAFLKLCPDESLTRSTCHSWSLQCLTALITVFSQPSAVIITRLERLLSHPTSAGGRCPTGSFLPLTLSLTCSSAATVKEALPNITVTQHLVSFVYHFCLCYSQLSS